MKTQSKQPQKPTVLAQITGWRVKSGAINGFYKSHRSLCSSMLKGTKKQDELTTELYTLERAWAAGMNMRWEAINTMNLNKVGGKPPAPGKLRNNARHRFKRILKNFEHETQLPVTFTSGKNGATEPKQMFEIKDDYSWPIYRHYMKAMAQSNYCGVTVTPDPLPAAKAGFDLALKQLAIRGVKGFFNKHASLGMDEDIELKGLMMVTSDLGRILTEHDAIPPIKALFSKDVMAMNQVPLTDDLPNSFRSIIHAYTDRKNTPNFEIMERDIFCNRNIQTNREIRDVIHRAVYSQLYADPAVNQAELTKMVLRRNKTYNKLKADIDLGRNDLLVHCFDVQSLHLDHAAQYRELMLWTCFFELEIEIEQLYFDAMIIFAHGGVTDLAALPLFKRVCRSPAVWQKAFAELKNRLETVCKLFQVDEDDDSTDDQCTAISQDFLLDLMGRRQFMSSITKYQMHIDQLTSVSTVIPNTKDSLMLFGKVMISKPIFSNDGHRLTMCYELMNGLLSNIPQGTPSSIQDAPMEDIEPSHSVEPGDMDQDDFKSACSDDLFEDKMVDELELGAQEQTGGMMNTLKSVFWG